MKKFNYDEIEELIEFAKGYDIIKNFIEDYNNINYVNFDYHIVHNFTLFLVDPDFDFEELEAQINRIVKVLPAIKRIFAKPVLHLTEKDEILPIEAVKKINSDTINHVARHSELWDDVDENGIKPLKLLSRMYQDNYGIYENLVFCKLIDDIMAFVRKKMRTLKNFNYVNQKMEFDLLQRVNHLNYFLALGKLHTGYVRNFDKYYVVSKHCLNGLNNIYNTIVPRMKRPVYRKNKQRPKKLKKTNILAMHRDYKHIYSLEKYFIDKKLEVNYDYDIFDYDELKNNYLGYCIILSIFSIGHFNFRCDENTIINYKKLNISFDYKKWNLKLKHVIANDVDIITITVTKDREYKAVLIPLIEMNDKDEFIYKVKDRINADDYFICIPYEKNEYEDNEICLDLSNLESFRRIQQIILKAMIYSDDERKDCPFCDHHLIPGEKENTYECESCRTLIVDAVCDKTGKRYSYTDILGYEKESIDSNKYKDEEWLYYRKKEAILHFRNITKLDDDGNVVCPICKKVH